MQTTINGPGTIIFWWKVSSEINNDLLRFTIGGSEQARISGVVHLNAVIAKDGTIQDLKVISGHPLLVPSALEAVKQWVYQPTLLNGEPVEVQTQIDVNFTLSQ